MWNFSTISQVRGLIWHLRGLMGFAKNMTPSLNGDSMFFGNDRLVLVEEELKRSRK